MADMRELCADGTSLLKAVWLRRLRLTRLLLEGGAYVNESNERGETPLMVACMSQHSDPQSTSKAKLVKYLLENKADPNIQDKAGRTALMHACSHRAGHEVVSLLLSNGADVSLEDHTGASVLVYAINADDKETLRLLLDSCKAKGKEVIIISMDKLPEGSKSTKQYLNVPPSPELESTCSPALCTSPFEISLQALPTPNDGKPQDGIFGCQATRAVSGPSATVVPSKPVTESASPVRKNLRRARLPQLKRLQSEPWGLVAPSILAAGAYEESRRSNSDEDVVTSISGLTLSRRAPLLRHSSVESKEGSGSLLSVGDLTSKMSPASQRMSHEKPLSQQQSLLKRGTVTDEQEAAASVVGMSVSLRDAMHWRLLGSDLYDSDSQLCSDLSALESPRAMLERRKPNTSSRSMLTDSRESLDGTIGAAPAPARHRAPGVLERRGSGTLLLDHISHTRPGFLPPLNVNPKPPIPDIGVSGKLSSPLSLCIRPTAPAVPSSPKRGGAKAKKKLLRRYSMQIEQMKQLSDFEELTNQ